MTGGLTVAVVTGAIDRALAAAAGGAGRDPPVKVAVARNMVVGRPGAMNCAPCAGGGAVWRSVSRARERGGRGAMNRALDTAADDAGGTRVARAGLTHSRQVPRCPPPALKD